MTIQHDKFLIVTLRNRSYEVNLTLLHLSPDDPHLGRRCVRIREIHTLCREYGPQTRERCRGALIGAQARLPTDVAARPRR